MKQKKGFTFIELIVAVTIAVLMIGFGSVALNDFNERQKINGAVKEIVANLRLARDYAVTNQLPQNGDRVLVTIDSNGVLIARPQTSGNVDIGNSFINDDMVSKGLTVTGDSQVRFSVTDGRLIGATAVNIGISGVQARNIRVDESGLIYEK